MAWLDAQEPGDPYLTAITAEELLFGAYILPVRGRRARLVGIIKAMLRDDFDGRILPHDGTASLFYALPVSAARECGITIGHAEGQIGAIVASQRRQRSRLVKLDHSRPCASRSVIHGRIGLDPYILTVGKSLMRVVRRGER